MCVSDDGLKPPKRRPSRTSGAGRVQVSNKLKKCLSPVNVSYCLTGSGSAQSRRFNVTVVQPEGAYGGQGEHLPPQNCVSPVPRHRGQPFASIPEDHALDDPPTAPLESERPVYSRGASPAPSWDFSLDDSDSVSIFFILTFSDVGHQTDHDVFNFSQKMYILM